MSIVGMGGGGWGSERLLAGLIGQDRTSMMSPCEYFASNRCLTILTRWTTLQQGPFSGAVSIQLLGKESTVTPRVDCIHPLSYTFSLPMHREDTHWEFARGTCPEKYIDKVCGARSRRYVRSNCSLVFHPAELVGDQGGQNEQHEESLQRTNTAGGEDRGAETKTSNREMN